MHILEKNIIKLSALFPHQEGINKMIKIKVQKTEIIENKQK